MTEFETKLIEKLSAIEAAIRQNNIAVAELNSYLCKQVNGIALKIEEVNYTIKRNG